MTRYPRWKFFLLLTALIVCGLYALPNLYPDAPAIQISHAEAVPEAPGGIRSSARQKSVQLRKSMGSVARHIWIIELLALGGAPL